MKSVKVLLGIISSDRRLLNIKPYNYDQLFVLLDE